MMDLMALIGCHPISVLPPKQDIDQLRERASYLEPLFDDDPDPLTVDRAHYKRLWSKANWRKKKEERRVEIAELAITAAAYLKQLDCDSSLTAIANRLECSEKRLRYAMWNNPEVVPVRKWIGGKRVTRWRVKR